MNTNSVVLVGRLTADPQKRMFDENYVVNFSIAVNDGYGEKKRVNFFTCEAWGKTGDIVVNFCGKGSRVCVTGKLKMKKWQDKEAKNREQITIYVLGVELLDPKKSSNEPQSQTTIKNDGFSEGDVPF